MNDKFETNIIEDIFILDSKNSYETALVKQCFDIVNVFVVAIDLNFNITLLNRNGHELLNLNQKIYWVKILLSFLFLMKSRKKHTSFFKKQLSQNRLLQIL
jgi:hypothetical protein